MACTLVERIYQRAVGRWPAVGGSGLRCWAGSDWRWPMTWGCC